MAIERDITGTFELGEASETRPSNIPLIAVQNPNGDMVQRALTKDEAFRFACYGPTMIQSLRLRIDELEKQLHKATK